MRASGRWRRFLGNAALVAFTVLLTAGVLEVAFRIRRAGRGGGKEERTTEAYTEYDAVLGWRKTAGGRATFHRREYEVEAVINSHGLRDEEHEYQPKPGTARILSLGDSFTEGYGVEAKDTATALLATLLGAPGCPVEAINGGTIGYSTDQEYLFYTQEGVKYGPQIVVLFFYYNDVRFNVADWYFGLPKPHLIRNKDGQLVLKRSPLPDGPFRQQSEKKKKQRRRAELEPEEPEGSALLEFVEERLRLGAPRLYNSLASIGLWAPIRPITPKPEMQVFWKDAPPYFERAWKATAEILAGLKAEVEGHGGHLLVAYVPSRMEVSDRDWELTRMQYGMDESWDRGLVLRRLAAIGAGAGFDVLDLTAAMRREDRGALGGPYYIYDGHWNKAGHLIAAREIAERVRSQSWLPACRAAGQ